MVRVDGACCQKQTQREVIGATMKMLIAVKNDGNGDDVMMLWWW